MRMMVRFSATYLCYRVFSSKIYPEEYFADIAIAYQQEIKELYAAGGRMFCPFA